MATAQMDTVIRHLRRAVLRQDGVDRTDGQLLASFIDQKDEAAFEALVRRHGPMVFGVCRRVVRNHHDAEDAFQATFLVLARKASSVRPRERVANWLHGVALRTAMKAMTAKRRGREQQVTEMPEPEAARQGDWRDLQPLLDQELNGLPENYRLPILLCDREGRRIKEAAQQLGWPQGTLAGRLARGRKLLANRLANRGVVLSAGSMAVILAQNVALAGVPTSLMSSTVKAATMIAAGKVSVAGVVPAQVAALTEGVLKAMLMSKLKGVTTVLLVLSLPLLGGGLWTTHSAVAQQATPASQAKVNEPSQPLTPPAVEKGEGRRPPHPPAVEKVEQGGNLTDMAAFYERTGHPKTAAFYRQLAARKDGKAQEKRFRGAADEVDLNERNFNTGLSVGVNYNSFLSGSEPTDAPKTDKADAPKTDLDRLQGIWSVVSIEQGGKPAKLEKAVFMVDGKRACWQTSESEMQGGLYLDPTSKPKTYDFVMSTRTIEGIYSQGGDTLRLCHDIGTEAKRPVGFATDKASHQVLFVLKRTHGPEVFPYRLPDGTRAFPPVIERVKKATPAPQEAPTPKDNNKYDLGLTAPRREEPPATKNQQNDFPVRADEGRRITVEAGTAAVKLGNGPADYKLIFGRTLGILAEYFEMIDYANQYEGRIEAHGRIVGTGPPDVIRKADVIIRPSDDDRFAIEIRIHRIKDANHKAEIVGRDADLEREILRRLNGSKASGGETPSNK